MNKSSIKSKSSCNDTVLVLLVGDTGVGQKNGNTTNTVHITLLIWCWTNFCLQYCINPSWNGLIQVLKSLQRICKQFCWRTSSNCFRDVGGGNLFLTIVSKTDQSGSMLLKSGDCAGQERCWRSSSCSSNYDWTVPVLWMRALTSWKSASLFGNNAWIMGCTWLHNLILRLKLGGSQAYDRSNG
jgi:hypothetical protein